MCVSPQVELTGSSVFDYIHPADHVEMAERLGIRPHLRAEAGCLTTPESASSSASTSSLAGTPEPGSHPSLAACAQGLRNLIQFAIKSKKLSGSAGDIGILISSLLLRSPF